MIEREELVRIVSRKQSGYFKFTVCRNPFTRLQSAYRDLVQSVEGKTPRGGACVENLRMDFCRAFDKKPSSVPHLTFEQFIRTLGCSNPANFDRHWQLQSVLTYSNLISYDYVLKMEEMPDRSAALVSAMGCSAVMDLNLNSFEDNGEEYRWSPASREVVTRVFARDFKRFNYDTDDWPR